MTEAPRFLLYKAAEHEQARTSSPYVRDLLAFLEHEGLRGEQAAVVLVRQREFDKAAVAAAKAEALQELLDIMHRPDLKEAEPEPEFEDPNLPPGARRK